jgi:NADH-quinone oxidoreductase subunit H
VAAASSRRDHRLDAGATSIAERAPMISYLSLEPIRILIYVVGICAFVGLNAAYLVLAERKIAGRIQRRPGPNEAGWGGWMQPFADVGKLLAKQIFLPPKTDRLLYCIAPLMVMIPPMLCLMAVPYAEQAVARELNLGLLFVFSFGSINVMALMLAGWASRNKYSIISSARVVSQNVAYEIPMLLVVITVLMVSGTMNLQDIVKQQAGGFWHWNILRGIWTLTNPLMPITFVIFFICMLAETNRAPFDMAEAESELVAGAFTEYGGMGFGVFFMAEYSNIVVGCCLATVLFLGGWQSPIGVLSGGVWGLGWFMVKTYALITTVMWIRWTFPRTQFYALLNLSWKILIPVSLFTLLLTGALLKLPLLWK